MTRDDLMKLVADYGKECISAGIAELNANDAVKQRMADDVRTAHVALTDRLRAILAELEAAREDAARYRWLRCDSREAAEIYNFNVDEDLDKAIDAARKGEA